MLMWMHALLCRERFYVILHMECMFKCLKTVPRGLRSDHSLPVAVFMDTSTTNLNSTVVGSDGVGLVKADTTVQVLNHRPMLQACLLLRFLHGTTDWWSQLCWKPTSASASEFLHNFTQSCCLYTGG